MVKTFVLFWHKVNIFTIWVESSHLNNFFVDSYFGETKIRLHDVC